MAIRFAFLAGLVALYIAGMQLAAHDAPTWVLAVLMGVVFLALVAAMYLRVLPALLALPILAIALASIAGMKWDAIFTTVVQDGSIRLGKWIIAAIFGSILAQVVEKTGIAQTAIKKTAELGGDRPAILAVLLTIVIALLFTTLGGLGAVIMVATIVIPILLSLGLRPLYVGCLFLLAMSLGGSFNLVNWMAYKETLGMSQNQIIAFALPFAGLMLVTTFIFLAIEGKRMGKARYKATVTEPETPTQFVPWYALLTPIIPLLPVLFFALLPKLLPPPVQVTFSALPASITLDNPVVIIHRAKPPVTMNGEISIVRDDAYPEITLTPGNTIQISNGYYIVDPQWSDTTTVHGRAYPSEFHATAGQQVTLNATIGTSGRSAISALTVDGPPPFEFPITVALLLGILYGAITTWRRGQSTVQLLTKASFDGVAAVGPALVLMVGIGMVLNATMAPEVSSVIAPELAKIVPHGAGMGAMLHYVVLFAVLAPMALYRGPLNLYGMGAGIMGPLQTLMPPGAIMGAFMAVGMIQGVSDPTNTHNVWVANYTNTDVQDILKRTLPYMWVLAIAGLVLSAALYYGGVIK